MEQPNIELVFASRPAGLSVRSFSVREGVNELFEVLVVARSSSADLDLEALVGTGTALRLAIGWQEGVGPRSRVWSGVASRIEQAAVEEDGLSTYVVRIVPTLWRTTQRRGCRIFQHLSTPEIAVALLAEWNIEPELRLDASGFAKHEYRVQYGESDFAFLCRLLEEAGISYWFEQREPAAEGALERMTVVLSDAPARAAHVLSTPIPFAGDTGDVPPTPHVRSLRLSHEVRPGRLAVRDHDFRLSPDLRLLAEARAAHALEERLELYQYAPGAFLAEGPGSGGTATTDVARGNAAAQVGLEAARTLKRAVEFASNVLELSAGVVFSLSGHPRADLCHEHGLFITRAELEGEPDREWTLRARATPTSDPFRPAFRTPRPRMNGIQSALVVGPEGEEIHTDAHGRVRVQFHWDRQGRNDDASSCWLRVSQAWAGNGYGFFALPRVGHEVLVDFLEGDPDRPIVVGRVHHSAALPPQALPQNKTRTSWRSSSSPGGGGSNEITFEDAAGGELVYVHAQRDLERMVEHDEQASIGGNLTTAVRQNETHTVEGDQSISVSGNRAVAVGGVFAIQAAAGLQAQAGSTGIFCEDGKLVLTNGATSIVLDGPNLVVDAAAGLQLTAGRTLSLGGQRVTIDGGPEVFINCAQALTPLPSLLPKALDALKALLAQGVAGTSTGLASIVQAVEDPGGVLDAQLYALVQNPVNAPPKISLPPAINQQLQSLSALSQKSGPLVSKILDSETFADIKGRLKEKLETERERLAKLGKDLHGIFDKQRDHVVALGRTLKARAAEEKVAFKTNWKEIRAVMKGERGSFVDSAKALYGAVSDEVKRINKLRKDLKSMLDTEKAYFKGAIDEWKGAVQGVKDTIDHFKNLIDNPKDEILDVLFGQDEDLKNAAEKFLDDPKAAIKDLLNSKGGSVGQAIGNLFHNENAPALPGGVGGVAPPPPPPAPPPPPPAGGPHMTPQVHAPAGGPQMAPQGQGPGAPQGVQGQMAPQGGSPQSLAGSGHMQAAGTHPGTPRGPELARGPAQASGQRVAQPGGAAVTGGPAAAGEVGQLGGTPSLGAGTGGTLGGAGSLAAQTSGAASGASSIAASGAAHGLAGGAGGELGPALARPGGLAAADVASTVSPSAPSFLQSPAEGQLMVVPGSGASPIDGTSLAGQLADAQMEGQPVGDAMTQALEGQGYVVYRRPAGDFWGELVRAGTGAAARA